ncbi:hypothetical protein BV898_12896 [Hypsibius exemplaris]|uniref:RING-type E3 ubiquitin transferase n=1 Tax=Hypsibius exemplaris TaxID=2072580 RepID=A0A1W0WCH2_HYPEX|nr:hypothetical protein BV898_12896 [Hypsibius exemplaris]
MDPGKWSALLRLGLLNSFVTVFGADVTVKSPQGIQMISLRANMATVGSGLPDTRLVGYIVRSRPVHACSPLSFATTNPDIALWLKPKILLVQEGPCPVSDQIQRAEEAGFVAIIIFSNSSNDVVGIGAEKLNTTIPAVLISQMDGILLWDKYVWSTGYYVVINEERTKMTVAWELILILIPVSIVIIPLAAIVIITIVAGRCPMFYTAYANARQRTKLVTSLPERKLIKEEVIEDGPACSICLEFYKVADKIRRILPCGHEFHSVCVDPWLLGDNLVCPLCRREVRMDLADHNSATLRKSDFLRRIYTLPLVSFGIPGIHPFPGRPERTTAAASEEHVV